MWFVCKVDGCGKRWQAHDSSNTELKGICKEHRRKPTTPLPKVFEFHYDEGRIRAPRTPVFIRTYTVTAA